MQNNDLKQLESLISRLIMDKKLTENDFFECYQRSLRKLNLDWLSLLTSDWFSSLLLKFINVIEISNLDTAFCSATVRPRWLDCLANNVTPSSFQNLKWNDKAIDWIVLKNLHFEELPMMLKQETLSSSSIYRLSLQCPNLRLMKIYSNGLENAVGDQCFQYIAALCPKLEVIDFRDVHLTNDDLIDLGKTCHKLTSVTLYPLISEHVNDTGLKGIVMTNNNIKHFEFTYYNDRSDAVLSYVGQFCPALETIHLENMVLTDRYIDIFTNGCRNLKNLRLEELGYETQGICNKMLKGLGKYNANLEELTLNAADRRESISVEAMKALALGCHKLHTLHISNTIIPAQGAKFLVENCPLITVISVWNCDINDAVLTEFGKLQYLRSLMICNNKDISDLGIISLVKDNHNLEYININGCKLITDASLIAIGNHCPHLKYIRIGVNSDDLTSLGKFRFLILFL